MTDTISRKLESKIDNKLISKSKRRGLEDGFKKGKVINEVLDKPTVMTLYKMITDHVIAYVNGSVSAGKESVVFWGVADDDADVALKIYLVSTSNFKKREPYIIGDPRFRHVKKGTKNLVYLWAKKEYRNLSQCYNAGIPVPRPLYVTNNVLAMDFVGVNGSPCRSLLTSNVQQNDYEHFYNKSTTKYKQAGFMNLILENVPLIFGDRIVEKGFRKAFKGDWGSEKHTKRPGLLQDLS